MDELMTIASLCDADEEIAVYGVDTDIWNQYFCIQKEGNTDIAGALEDTLHRLLDSGMADDVRRIMGAYVPDEEELNEHEEDDYIDIDLGYIIPGHLLAYNPLPDVLARTRIVSGYGIWDVTGKYEANISSIANVLVKKAGTICENYAGDIFTDWIYLQNMLGSRLKNPVKFLIGFRKNGVDSGKVVKHNLSHGKFECYDSVVELTMVEENHDRELSIFLDEVSLQFP